MNTIDNIKNKVSIYFIGSFLVVMSIWWFSIFFRGLTEGPENEWFTNIYFIIPLVGGIVGIFASKRWGGFKSNLGRAILAFSIGLLGQAFGQIMYNFYAIVLHIEIPYPSIGDFGFFSTGFFYIYGLFQLAKVIGAKITFRTFKGRSIAIILPLLFMAVSYYIFLVGFDYDWQHPVRVILDLTWPLIDSLFLAFAILAWLLSKDFLGGMMKKYVLLLLVALAVEAVADLNFIYRYSRDLWYPAGVNDYMYIVAYSLMAIALIRIGVLFNKINE